MDTLCCPLGAGMVPECPLCGAVRGSVCLGEGSISVIPVRGNDGEHLAALQGHLDDVLVWEAGSTLSRPRASDKDVHNIKEVVVLPQL